MHPLQNHYKNFVCESIAKEILKHYYNSMYVVLMQW